MFAVPVLAAMNTGRRTWYRGQRRVFIECILR